MSVCGSAEAVQATTEAYEEELEDDGEDGE